MIKYTTVAVMLVSLVGSIGAANAFKIESTTADAGQQDLEVRILIDNDEDVLGLSVAGTYDDGLTFDNLSVEGTEFGPGNLDADFVQQMKWGNVFGVAIVIELPDTIEDPYLKTSLPAGTGQYAVKLVFDVDDGLAPGTVLNIDLRDDLLSCDPTDTQNCSDDPPEVAPVFTVNGASVDPPPALVDGTVTIVGPPDATSIVPAAGCATGGTGVTINGSGFTADTVVTIGGLELVGKTLVDPSTITGTTPAHAAGTVDVVVSNTEGSDILTGAAGFTYVDAPTVTAVNPSQGTGDVDVTITGTGFTTDTDIVVLMGLEEATNVTVVSSTELTCRLPACGGTQDEYLSISVTTSCGTGSLDNAYCCGDCGAVVFKRGDSNRDGGVNIADAVYILQNLFAQGPDILCMDAADSNDDEAVNIADAVYILQNLFAQGPDIPAPGVTSCGPDPTPHPTPGEPDLPPCDYCAGACEDPPVACQ